MTEHATTPEPAPSTGQVRVYDLVVRELRGPINRQLVADLTARMEMGVAKYGTPLMTHNGRDPLVDAYQESLDLVMYLRQAEAEHGIEEQQYFLALNLARSLCRAVHAR